MKPFVRQALLRQRERLHELDALLSAPDVMDSLARFRTLSREHAEASALVQRFNRFLDLEREQAEAQAWLTQDDAGLAELAREELPRLQAERDALDDELQQRLLPRDPDDERAAFVEVRAGTGGDESALFAGDLVRMYSRYAANKGWQVELVSESPSDLGGYKEAVLRIASRGLDETGTGVYGLLRFESGGHRVQRVPVTETQGRIHTSAATVAVMPEPDEAEAVKLNPAELRIDTFRASGAGGQHINKTDSAVRVTHLPTGITAECQDGRSQHSNKAKALQVLAARLAEKDRSERAAQEAATRKGLVGSGDRSDRIRTYNFPQGRLTDHRINLTLYQLETILEGDLDPVIHALRVARGAELLAELEQAQAGNAP